MGKSASRIFSQETLRFLGDLERNNNRDWFNANKSRYEEHVLDPSLRFIVAMQEPLEKVAPHFEATPKRVGGSLMRIYRDVRFSKNKTPYKTNIGIQFRHEVGKDVHAPGYYLHIESGQVFVGAGMWRPHSEPLRKIRERISENGRAWSAVVKDRVFRRHFELSGDSLTRPPRGFSNEQPRIEDIKRKDFIAVKSFATDAVHAPKFEKRVVTAFAAADPLMRFLCKAVDVPF